MQKKESKKPFLFLFIIFFLLHLLLPHIRDDRVIEQGMDFTPITPSYIGYLITSKYQEWSSRIFINVMTLVMGKLPHIIWIVLDSAMVLLSVWSIFELTDVEERDNKKVASFLVTLFLLYPFSHMATAGWKATTVTYLWALACGLYAMIPITRYLTKTKIKRWEYPLFFLALLYGANQEQMSAVLTGIYGCVIVYAFAVAKKQNRKIPKFFFLQFFACFASFLLALFSPGNNTRSSDETTTWFADYARLSLVNKLEIGISSAGYELFYSANLCFFVLSGLLLLLVILKYKEKEYRILAMCPFLSSLVFGVCYPIMVSLFPALEKWKTMLTQYGTITVENYTTRFSYLPFFGICLLFCCVLVTFYLIYENSWKSCAMCVIFFIGYASRVVLAFSPTVWASSYRTYLFLYASILVLAVFAYQEFLRIKKEKNFEFSWLGKAESVLYIIAVISFISQGFSV